MGMQRALGISGGARGVDDDGGIVGRGIDGRELVGGGFDRRPERFGAGGNGAAGDVDIPQVRQPVADFRELLPAAFVGHDRLGAGIGKTKLQRVLAEQREQRHRHQAGAERRQMRDRQFQRLRQKRRDPVAARKPVGLQHIGEAARQRAHLVERGARRAAVLVDIDQRQPAGAVGMAVAARGRDVEARRDVPAEVAVEFGVVGGFGEHDARLDDRRPGINPLPLCSRSHQTHDRSGAQQHLELTSHAGRLTTPVGVANPSMVRIRFSSHQPYSEAQSSNFRLIPRS